MELFVVDAFTTRRFSGNQAGVALLDTADFPSVDFMQSLAGELKHSETAFVGDLGERTYQIRYFTPEGEVELCGHATIASFTALHRTGRIAFGNYTARTLAGVIRVGVDQDGVWMGMAPAQEGQTFTEAQAQELYQAYGLSTEHQPQGYPVQAVSTGLMDILLPVDSRGTLNRAVQDEAKVKALSEQYDVVGVHMFYPSLDSQATCHCRNFAPRYAIPEECATGTSNAALTHYLHRLGKIAPGQVQTFRQGEKMGRLSEILTQVIPFGDRADIQVGGQAVMSLSIDILDEK